MFFYLKKILSALVLPPTGLLLLAVIGVVLARRHSRLGGAIAISALAALLLLSMPAVSGHLIGSLEAIPPISARELERAQAIVVLTGGNYHNAPEYGGDTVSGLGLERARYAVYLQRA